jgi:hypothetical protein
MMFNSDCYSCLLDNCKHISPQPLNSVILLNDLSNSSNRQERAINHVVFSSIEQRHEQLDQLQVHLFFD